jgi:2-methylcitrate dehydratase PrpD
MSAFVGYSGFNGPEDILGGKRGFFSVMGDPAKPILTGSIGAEPLALDGIYQKPYASCRHCHPAIEAAIHLKQRHNLDLDSIVAIRVKTYGLAVLGHDHSTIKGVTSAKMSIPFSVAVALKHGSAGISEFNEQAIEDGQLLRVTQMVKVSADEELSILVPEKRAAIVEVDIESGLSYAERVDFPKGEPENPLTDRELYSKFLELARHGGLTIDQAEQLAGFTENLEIQGDYKAMFALLS